MASSSISSYTSSVSSTTKEQIDELIANYKITISKPLTNLSTQKTTLTNRKTTFTSLKSKLDSWNDDLKDLARTDYLSTLNSTKVTSSNKDILTATTYGNAYPSSHSISVERVAKSDKVISSKFAKTETTTIPAGTYTFSISVDGSDYNVSVDVSDGETSNAVFLKIINAINQSGATKKITASVVSDSSKSNRLILSSKNSGSSNAIVLNDTSGGLLKTLGFISGGQERNKASGNNGGYLVRNVDDLNASFTIDGIDVTSESNIVKNVLEGVALELKGTSDPNESDVTLSIETDKDDVKSTVDNFIKKYNEIMTLLDEKLTTKDGVRAELSTDSQLRQLKEKLRSTVIGEVTSVHSGNPAFLENIGIVADSNGKLSLKYAYKLNEYLDDDPSKVYDLFNSSNGIANKLITLIKPYFESDGILDKRTDQIESQIKSITDRITSTQEQIDKKAENYRKQYEKLLTTINNLSSQQYLIQSMLNSSSTTTY